MGFFFHRTVTTKEICTALGFTSSELSNYVNFPEYRPVGLCQDWYPNRYLRTFPNCLVAPFTLKWEPLTYNVSCSTICANECKMCSNASLCDVCKDGFFKNSIGLCVNSSSCGIGFYGSSTSKNGGGPICAGIL